MKIVGIIQWEAANKAVAMCYANTSSDLTNKVADVDIVAGSIAYLGSGSVYVYNGTQWNEMGA